MVALSPNFAQLPARFNAGGRLDCLADKLHGRSL
jgi:hypothetical protein